MGKDLFDIQYKFILLWLDNVLYECANRGQTDGRQDQNHKQQVAEHLQKTVLSFIVVATT